MRSIGHRPTRQGFALPHAIERVDVAGRCATLRALLLARARADQPCRRDVTRELQRLLRVSLRLRAESRRRADDASGGQRGGVPLRTSAEFEIIKNIKVRRLSKRFVDRAHGARARARQETCCFVALDVARAESGLVDFATRAGKRDATCVFFARVLTSLARTGQSNGESAGVASYRCASFAVSVWLWLTSGGAGCQMAASSRWAAGAQRNARRS